LYNGKPQFEKMTRDQVVDLMCMCATSIKSLPAAVSYGAVDTGRVRSGIYATAKPADIAFRLCIEGVEAWFEKHAPDDFGLFICDTDKAKNHDLLAAFRAYRKRLKSDAGSRGMLKHAHDDMYFGDSAYSRGLQMADIAAYLILRHLQRKQDTEHIYGIIRGNIVAAKIAPESSSYSALIEVGA
jgi:hypothetical protein